MSRWTKEAALQELVTLVEETERLQGSYRLSAEHTRWFVRTRQFLDEVFGRRSIYLTLLTRLSWQPAGTFILESWDLEGALEARYYRAYLEALETAKGLLQAAHDALSVKTLEDVYHGKHTAPESSHIVKVLTIIEQRLRKVIRERPERERQVQDALENLLVGAGIEYSRETESIEYSSKTYTPDFSLSRLDLAIELKLCPRPEREKEIIAEINDDILAYKQKYGNIFFVVYDLGCIRDVDRFVVQFEETEGVLVRVIKH